MGKHEYVFFFFLVFVGLVSGQRACVCPYTRCVCVFVFACLLHATHAPKLLLRRQGLQDEEEADVVEQARDPGDEEGRHTHPNGHEKQQHPAPAPALGVVHGVEPLVFQDLFGK